MAVEGLQQVLSRLKNVQNKVANKIVRAAVSGESKAVLTQAKAAVRVDLGILKRSLGRKIKVFAKDSTAVGIVGPRSSFRMKKTKIDGRVVRVRVATGIGKQVVRHGKEQFAWPSKYSHLVEKGTRRSRAFPFLTPAGKAVSVSRMAAVIGAGIEAAGEGQ